MQSTNTAWLHNQGLYQKLYRRFEKICGPFVEKVFPERKQKGSNLQKVFYGVNIMLHTMISGDQTAYYYEIRSHC